MSKTPKPVWARFFLMLPISTTVLVIMVVLWTVQCVIEYVEMLYRAFYRFRHHFILTGKFHRP